MRILTVRTVAVIIDVQERLYPHIHENEKLEKNLRTLISGLKILEIPLILTEQYPKGLGSTIPSLKEMLQSFPRIEKISFSCCDEPVFMKSLADSGKKCILVAGIESHVCVLQTVIDLLNQNFLPVIIEDCVSSRNLNDKRVALKRMRGEGAIISTTESILFELLRVSGTEQFKAISKLVK
jgi:nicotinamidase-related amidase